MVFLRSRFWSLNSGRASTKRSVNRGTCGETGILSYLRSLLYMDCNSATTKENFPCMLHCSFTKCIIFRKCNFSKKFSHGLSGAAVSCFIAAEYLLLNRSKHFCDNKFHWQLHLQWKRFSSQRFSELAHMRGMNLIWLSMQCPCGTKIVRFI